jgi:rod shape determining protein RodA
MTFLQKIKTFSPDYSAGGFAKKTLWEKVHIDVPLLLSLLCLAFFGFIILYSAGNENFNLVEQQALHIAVAIGIMGIFAQISPHTYERWAVGIYIVGTLLLLSVLILGHVNKGAQRWLGAGAFRFQPSEILKLAIPLMLSYVLSRPPLPPSIKKSFLCLLIIGIPAILTAKEPDLGTSIVLASTGFFVLFLAGLSWRFIIVTCLAGASLLPLLWYSMHDYQRVRVLTFVNPERDPLGSGYHIIQSKIALGSGGGLGMGWLQGSQSHLRFLPEHTTDFIFAVCGEEFGFIGLFVLIAVYLTILFRCAYITLQAQDSFSRLLAGSLSLMFFISLYINMGMVSGILPVVGVPLPLVSYGGTSLVTLLASFGILMSIQTHRKLVPS